MSLREHVVLLIGGVGGAKLAAGMAEVLPPGALTIIVNTGDDFEHLGLHVSPDLDTVMYTLAGLANQTTGWGVADDTFQAVEMAARYGAPEWFRLGDRDLGTNLVRTMRLRAGATLTEIVCQMSAALGIRHTLLPMSDDAVRTQVDTDQGELAFQEYFVRERWQPAVREIRFIGAADARPTSRVIKALDCATLIVIGPSNPYLSIDPILAVPGIRSRIAASPAPCVAISPLIAGQAVKGPTAKLMAELGIDVSPLTVVNHYRDLLNAIILDEVDHALCQAVEQTGVRAVTYPILMKSLQDKVAVAEFLLNWSEENLT